MLRYWVLLLLLWSIVVVKEIFWPLISETVCSLVSAIEIAMSYYVCRPRLGADQNKVVGIGILFFILSSIEGCMRVAKVRLNTHQNTASFTYSQLLQGSMLTHTYPQKLLRKWLFAITRLTAHLTYGLVSDPVVCKHRKEYGYTWHRICLLSYGTTW